MGILGLLGRWDVSVSFAEDLGTTRDGSPVAMEVNFSGPYLSATLRVCRKQFDKKTPRAREASTLHELGHVALHPISSTIWRHIGRSTQVEIALEDAEETVVDNLVQALLGARYGPEALLARFVKEPKSGAS